MIKWKHTITLGILTLSYDYKECGDLGGTICIIVAGVFVVYGNSLYLNLMDNYPEG